ncbi:hypothetical protein [Schinkia azotoformans]|uniref:hypothetical protein n=1 Tax=Schinkia azotoformans TaxID=1454 RepID=UPI002DB5BC0C|nr:hypothetical protein [Schinkia azotoformans]MEC1719143.1 hypothetical protein [Schinkia azotoformans]MED4413809.1 hypothetical protein [Schinkia azotoformans]
MRKRWKVLSLFISVILLVYVLNIDNILAMSQANRLSNGKNISEFVFTGENPPYTKDTKWLESFSRPHVEALPVQYHEAMFFNNKKTFEEFTSRFKGVLKRWISEMEQKNINDSEKVKEYFKTKLDKYYRDNEDYFKGLYPRLTEKQYRLLMSMNLAHGNYQFGTQTTSVDSFVSLTMLEMGDCSELADLTASLASIQGINGTFLGLGWDYQSSLGQFISGHQVFYSEGLWLDAEINTAFLVDINKILKIEPSERFISLMENNQILGFYNWYLKPEIRDAQLKNGQDGGVIAFYYYYYFEGLGQGKSNILPYFPTAIINDKSPDSRVLNVNNDIIKLNHKLSKENTPADFEILPGQSAFNFLDKQLIESLEKTNPAQIYDEVIPQGFLLNSLASYIELSNKKVDLLSEEKKNFLIKLAINEMNQLLGAKGVNEGEILGWGRSDKFDAFQDGTENPEYTKYTYQTFESSYSILNLVEAIKSNHALYNRHKNELDKIVKEVEKIALSWESRYYKTGEKKGYYGYSEYEHDNISVLNISGSSLSMYLKLYKLTNNEIYFVRAKEILNYLLDYIKIDGTSGAYIWPYDLRTQRIDDVRHAMLTTRGILEAAQLGLIDGFESWRMTKAIEGFWSGKVRNPNIYISSPYSHATIDDSQVAAAVNFAQLYNTIDVSNYLWFYSKALINTNLLASENSTLDKRGFQLHLIALLLNDIPEQQENSKLTFKENGNVGIKENIFGTIKINSNITRGNANYGEFGLFGKQPYFEIFESDQLALEYSNKENLNELLINMTYRVKGDSHIKVVDNDGNILLNDKLGNNEDLNLWSVNAFKLENISKVDSLNIYITGPIDIVEIDFSKL